MSIEVIRQVAIVGLGIATVLLFFTSQAQYQAGLWLVGTSSIVTALALLLVVLWLYRRGGSALSTKSGAGIGITTYKGDIKA